MSLSARVARLRQHSLAAVPTLCSERARLVTEWYAAHSELLSAPMERALVFEHLLKNVTVKIWPDELIVGEKGPGPKAAPTYPELCCHSLQDLDILDSRENVMIQTKLESPPEEVSIWS